METVLNLPPHITEEDVALITRLMIPTIVADAWDQGFIAGEETATGANIRNPYRPPGRSSDTPTGENE